MSIDGFLVPIFGRSSTQLRAPRGQEIRRVHLDGRQSDLLERDRTPDSGSHFATSDLVIHVKMFSLVIPKCQTWTVLSMILEVL